MAGFGPLPSTAVARVERDTRIDLLRSVFILSLCGTHFTWLATLAGFHFPIRWYDTQALGFTSPAEFFVFFSGYVMTLTVARTAAQRGVAWSFLQCLRRSWQLFMLNLVAMIVVIAMAPFIFHGETALLQAVRLDALLTQGFGDLWQYLVFREEIGFFEILRNYILFIPLTPLFIFAGRRFPEIPLVACILLWAGAQVVFAEGNAFHSFNPWCWQLLYFLGAYFAMRAPLSRWRSVARAKELQVLAGLLAAAFAAKVWFSVAFWFGYDVPWTDKTNVQVLRLLHFLVLLRFVVLVLPPSEKIAEWPLFKLVRPVGANALEAFCLANVLLYLCTELFILSGKMEVAYFVLLALFMAMVVGSAHAIGWIKTEPWREKAKPKREPSRPEAAPLRLSQA